MDHLGALIRSLGVRYKSFSVTWQKTSVNLWTSSSISDGCGLMGPKSVCDSRQRFCKISEFIFRALPKGAQVATTGFHKSWVTVPVSNVNRKWKRKSAYNLFLHCVKRTVDEKLDPAIHCWVAFGSGSDDPSLIIRQWGGRWVKLSADYFIGKIVSSYTKWATRGEENLASFLLKTTQVMGRCVRESAGV